MVAKLCTYIQYIVSTRKIKGIAPEANKPYIYNGFDHIQAAVLAFGGFKSDVFHEFISKYC